MDDCDRLKKYISDYIEGQLDPSTRRQFEAQLKENPELQELTSRVSGVSRLLKQLPPQKCSEDFNIRLRERIYNEPAKKWMSAKVRRYSLGFSFVIVIAVVIFAFNSQIEDNKDAQFIPIQNQISSDDSYNGESFNVKTREEQPAIPDSMNIKKKEKKDPRIKYVDQQK
jgi:hypothetical protein